MKKIVMYAHGGSENHGCEAIVRSTLDLLNDKYKPILLSYRKDQDIEYGLDKLVEVRQEIGSFNKVSLDFMQAYFYQKCFGEYYKMDALLHKNSISNLEQIDISLFIGGDNYCYSGAEKYFMINKYMRKKSKKMVLWGASVEPNLLRNPIIESDIKQYDYIFARESISYEALKRINDNTYLYPDPAFYLSRERIDLSSDLLKQNLIGINLSPLITEYERNKGIALKNYEVLIRYILNDTNYGIALIPHVVWKSNDDREILKILYNRYNQTNRVFLVNDYNCEQQKHIISKCDFFIGARTHATIAAYSSLVPTIVVGYSVKARGIARDLFGTEKNYVVPVQKLESENDLTIAFRWCFEHKNEIKSKLTLKMSEILEKKYDYAKEMYE